MENLTNLLITQYGANQNDQIMDSYDLIKGIIEKLDCHSNLKFKLDNTLPLIEGDPHHLILLFKDFIRKTIELFGGLTGEINIIHIKNPKSWIFAFFAIGSQQEGTEKVCTNIVETINEVHLAISKKSIYNKEHLILIN